MEDRTLPFELDAESYKQYAHVFGFMIKIHERRGRSDLEIDEWIRDLVPTFDTDEKLEKHYKDNLELKVPGANLEDVHLKYIPDYIRELRTKKDYWKKEFNYWKDIISQKNWKLYIKKEKDEVYRHKTILKNLDKMFQNLKPSSENKTHFSQSLDPERVQALVNSIKEHESEDKPFRAMVNAVERDNDRDPIEILYILYAIYARYGEFRVRPSRKNSLQVQEEDSKLSRNKELKIIKWRLSQQ